MSTTDTTRPRHPNLVSVQIREEDDGEEFTCDEEPNVLSYEQGFGYYPLTLGQKLENCKVEIVRKLGWANNSSVWLGRTIDGAYPSKYVAVKVLTVNATASVLYGHTLEVNNLRKVAKANPSHPGYKHCLRLYHATTEDSHCGPHMCLVTNVLGFDMYQLRHVMPDRTFPLDFVKQVIKETLLALDYTHRECGLVHADVKPDNILMYSENDDDQISIFLEEEPSETYPPRIEPQLSPDPIITVKSQPLPLFAHARDVTGYSICLADYGLATPVQDGLYDIVQPELLRAPEVTLGYPWSTPVDIWSVGCLVFEFINGVPLFKSSEEDFDRSHIRQTLELFGPFSSGFLAECKRRARFFDDTGSFKHEKFLATRSIEDEFRRYRRISDDEILKASVFMRRCFSLDPNLRATALELLDDEWLKNI